MAGVNKVILIGNVGKDPELRYTPQGTAVATFSLATSSRKSKNSDKPEKTEWHRIVAWDKLAEFAGEWIKKGKTIYVEGNITYREWQDKEGGKRNTTEIIAREIQFVGAKGSDTGTGGGGGSYDAAPSYGGPPRAKGATASAGGGRDLSDMNAPVDTPPGDMIDDDDVPF